MFDAEPDLAGPKRAYERRLSVAFVALRDLAYMIGADNVFVMYVLEVRNEKAQLRLEDRGSAFESSTEEGLLSEEAQSSSPTALMNARASADWRCWARQRLHTERRW